MLHHKKRHLTKNVSWTLDALFFRLIYAGVTTGKRTDKWVRFSEKWR